MRLAVLLGLGAAAIVAALFVRSRLPKPHEVSAPGIATHELTPICSWRDPARDLKILFPRATTYSIETRVLSSVMVPVQKQLGRVMEADENPLRIYRVSNGTNLAGSILVHRVKGEYGAIEVVTGVHRGVTRGVLIQSQREPEIVARAITNSAWLGAFIGKTAAAPLRLGEDLPELPAEARLSARAIADRVRAQLVLLSFAESHGFDHSVQPHH